MQHSLELILVPFDHNGSVHAVAINPKNDEQVISGSDDKTLRLWNLKTGKCERTLTVRTDRVDAVAITPDGKHVISASSSGFFDSKKIEREIVIWNLETGKPQILSADSVRRNSDENSSCNLLSGVVAIHPNDDKQVISGSRDNELRVWNLESGKNKGKLIGFAEHLSAVAITRDKLVISDSNTALKVWNLKTGEELFTLKGHSDLVRAIAVTSDGTKAISASWDSTVKVWNLKDTAVTNNQIDYFNDTLKAIAVTVNGKWLIKAFSDGSLKALNLELQKETVISPSLSDAFAVTPDSKQVISGLSNGKLEVFNLETGKKFSLGSYFDYYRDYLSWLTANINSSYFPSITGYSLDNGKERLYPGTHFNYLLCINCLLIWPVVVLIRLILKKPFDRYSYFDYYLHIASIITSLISLPVFFLLDLLLNNKRARRVNI